ncbi:aminomethyl-transferring glycine dehydrogenase [Granulosicoccus sp.]|nr:aminomethyl-transferring glycine dehydrogenase [Granulosicoccus sp.]MDB4222879.1 aminomethyl-transferring glycine dehydrogenase [Granulosicoccus sp.]
MNNQISEFVSRHIGPRSNDVDRMLGTLGLESLESLIDQVVPEGIRQSEKLANLGHGLSEASALSEIRQLASLNVVNRSALGQGYYDCHLPSVIQRNVFENPAWYTAYTPYQPEIAQGRLEVLFNFQTMICELTGMSIANASLLDEATAAAEAMAMAHRVSRGKRSVILVASDCHEQSVNVLNTRAEPLGIEVRQVAATQIIAELDSAAADVFAILLQYPGTFGDVHVGSDITEAAAAAGAMSIVAADLLGLTVLSPPGEWGADIVVGSAQRFGVPMGFGGPHAAFMATTDKHKRSLPGRLVGESITSDGNPAYRLALQTREQHIRREKATSNICTAQALLAIIATLYACYHGPAGLIGIARRVRGMTDQLSASCQQSGLSINNEQWFDTLSIQVGDSEACVQRALALGYNVRKIDDNNVGVSLDETTTAIDVQSLLSALSGQELSACELAEPAIRSTDTDRKPTFLSQTCFHEFHSETEMMRYLRRLASKDIALDQAMIPLGSCTMKLNAAAEMSPLSWPELASIHPFAPDDQTLGYKRLITDLERMLCDCTGYDAMSLQPNAGSQGEYAGLLAIKRYHESQGEPHRDVCLIPSSAHGTNPASAQMAGMKVVVVACDANGNVDLSDLDAKLEKHAEKVAAIMITYPSTHGVFETEVRTVCERVHAAGGQVYIDGANLNAMVGTAEPGSFGGDVSHLNLHKTFCIPHGGGGPGVGPIGVKAHLAPWLPGHHVMGDSTGVVSAAPYGSALILPITWMYIRMMGSEGLRQATHTAILSANYIAKRLSLAYPILYRGHAGYVAHECILDTRVLKEETGVSVDDIAKRLMDFGFHAPTMSFPVSGTLMVEPTESESLKEIDRFCDAMLTIAEEARLIIDESSAYTLADNPLVNAPHTANALSDDEWNHTYTRRTAVFPQGVTPESKYWPPVSRIDNVHGDKNLICSCPPLSSYEIES